MKVSTIFAEFAKYPEIVELGTANTAITVSLFLIIIARKVV